MFADSIDIVKTRRISVNENIIKTVKSVKDSDPWINDDKTKLKITIGVETNAEKMYQHTNSIGHANWEMGCPSRSWTVILLKKSKYVTLNDEWKIYEVSNHLKIP